MNKAACKKHSKNRRDREAPKILSPRPVLIFPPQSDVPPEEFDVNLCCEDSASSTCSTNHSQCYEYSCCQPRSPHSEESYLSQSQDSRSRHRSRHSSPHVDDYSSYSQSEYPPSGNAKGDSLVSIHMLYAAIIICILGMLIFMLRKHILDVNTGCHVCDERMLPESHDFHKLERSSEKYVVDYASEENGAFVESHDTFHYVQRGSFAAVDLFQLPKVESVLPDTMLKDNNECFAMQGHTGTFRIRLSRPIVVEAVTLVHEKAECDAAPRDFKIYGVKDLKEEVQVNLGGFRYENRGSAAQKFVVPKFHEFEYIRLTILTNWGNREYTCIYKIRVHGEPVH